MSYGRSGDSLDWLSLFSIPFGKKKETIRMLGEYQRQYSAEILASHMIAKQSPTGLKLSSSEAALQNACEHVALRFMIEETEIARDFLNNEDYEKAVALFQRKQYNSKILKGLLATFLCLLQDTHTLDSKVQTLFVLPILSRLKIERDAETERSFGELKTIVDKVTSGVKPICYFDAKKGWGMQDDLNEDLNSFVIEKYGYDFNKTRDYGFGITTLIPFDEQFFSDNEILQTAILDNPSFWEKNRSFGVVDFINKIAEANSIKHAEKLLTHIFDSLKKAENADVVLSANLTLYAMNYNKLLAELEDQSRRFSFRRLAEYCDVSVLDSYCTCYPMNKGDEQALANGKRLFEKFISDYNYRDSKDTVMAFLTEEVNKYVRGEDNLGIAAILDCGPFRYTADDLDRRIFSAYHSNCLSAESIRNRVYLKTHAVTLLTDSEETQLAYLQRMFIDLIREIERRIDVKTIHQMDMSSRTKHFSMLKEKLAEYEIIPSDEIMNDYVVPLLDSDVALREERERFPALEQLGDAIYDLAVTRLLFYNPNIVLPWNTKKSIASLHEHFTRAEAQVFISKKLGFDKLFLHAGLPLKAVEIDFDVFSYEDASDKQLEPLREEKYLADSLEMIIGSICKDKGPTVAVEFTKKLLSSVFPGTMPGEIYPTKDSVNDNNIDYDYWNVIFAAPYSQAQSGHTLLWGSLCTVMLAVTLGTDDKEKRSFITRYADAHICEIGSGAWNATYSVNWLLYDYLINYQDPLSFVLNKYRDECHEFYHQNKDKA